MPLAEMGWIETLTPTAYLAAGMVVATVASRHTSKVESMKNYLDYLVSLSWRVLEVMPKIAFVIFALLVFPCLLIAGAWAAFSLAWYG